jgi:hypothetical protein
MRFDSIPSLGVQADHYLGSAREEVRWLSGNSPNFLNSVPTQPLSTVRQVAHPNGDLHESSDTGSIILSFLVFVLGLLEQTSVWCV